MNQLNTLEHSVTSSTDVTAPFRMSSPPIRMKAPGTCGQLVQGEIDGRDFLVKCPIDLFSRATIEAAPFPGFRVRDADQYEKICNAGAFLAHEHRLTLAHKISVESAIPRSKGTTSSTAVDHTRRQYPRKRGAALIVLTVSPTLVMQKLEGLEELAAVEDSGMTQKASPALNDTPAGNVDRQPWASKKRKQALHRPRRR